MKGRSVSFQITRHFMQNTKVDTMEDKKRKGVWNLYNKEPETLRHLATSIIQNKKMLNKMLPISYAINRNGFLSEQ